MVSQCGHRTMVNVKGKGVPMGGVAQEQRYQVRTESRLSAAWGPWLKALSGILSDICGCVCLLLLSPPLQVGLHRSWFAEVPVPVLFLLYSAALLLCMLCHACIGSFTSNFAFSEEPKSNHCLRQCPELTAGSTRASRIVCAGVWPASYATHLEQADPVSHITHSSVPKGEDSKLVTTGLSTDSRKYVYARLISPINTSSMRKKTTDQYPPGSVKTI